MLTPKDIASMLDHSTLQPFLVDEDIVRGCEIAKKYGTASVCARPQDMKLVSSLLTGSGVKPCTVIGFPHGSHLTAVKVFEAEQAIKDGCEELDMVLAIGKMKSGEYDYVEADIRAVAEAAHKGGAILKVILENCYLTDEEKITMGLCCSCPTEMKNKPPGSFLIASKKKKKSKSSSPNS